MTSYTVPALHGTLDQWRALAAVVDQGGYAQAASYLSRSQSTINYSVSKLENQLGVSLLKVKGRKAYLTSTGEILLNRARQLLNQAVELEQLAKSISKGREAEIQLVVDAAFPTSTLMQALKEFEPGSKGTRVQLREVVLSGAVEALESGNADLVITGMVPANFLGKHIINVDFVALAHPQHPLHQLGRPLTTSDLHQHVQVVVRDSGTKQQVDVGWLDAEQRWTVSSLDTALTALTAGLGFAWLPCHQVQEKIDRQQLSILPLSDGGNYQTSLYMVYGKLDNTGPATRELGEILSNCCA